MRRLTLRLLLIRCDGAYEVLGSHVDFTVPMLAYDFQCGKVAENLVRSGVGPYPVLVLHHLPTREETPVNETALGNGINFDEYKHQPNRRCKKNPILYNKRGFRESGEG